MPNDLLCKLKNQISFSKGKVDHFKHFYNIFGIFEYREFARCNESNRIASANNSTGVFFIGNTLTAQLSVCYNYFSTWC